MDKGRIQLALGCCVLGVSVLMMSCAQNNTVYQPAIAKLIEKASAFKNQSHLDEAICRLKAAEDLGPDVYQVHYNLGVLYSEANQWQPAIDELQKALKISPNQPDSLYTLAYSYESLGDMLSGSPGSPSTEKTKTSTASSTTSVSGQDEAKQAYQEALATYQQYLKVAPQNSQQAKDAQGESTYLESKLKQ